MLGMYLLTVHLLTKPEMGLRGQAGWTQVSASGVSMSFPPGLKVINLTFGTGATISQAVEKLFPNNPAIVAQAQEALKSGSIKLMALNDHSESGKFRNNFNLVVLPIPPSLTLEALVQASAAQIKPVAIPGSFSSSFVQLNVGKAGFMSCDLTGYSCAQYVLIRNSKQYVFSFSSSRGTKNAWAAQAKAVMRTVHFH